MGWDWGHIRFCGYGGLGFRPDGGSLGEAPSNQALLPLTFGASLRLGMPSLRSCSVGPPPSAIHGRGRLTRHPCRVAHYAEPALGFSMGRVPPKAKRGGLPAGLILQRLRVLIVPMLRVGMPPGTLCVPLSTPALSLAQGDAERHGRHSHAEHGNDQSGPAQRFCSSPLIRSSVSSPSAFDLDLDLPRREAERRFCAVGNPAWMADGGGPTEQDRSEGMPSLGEAPYVRGASAWLLGASPSDPP